MEHKQSLNGWCSATVIQWTITRLIQFDSNLSEENRAGIDSRKKSRIQINQNNGRKNHRTGVSQSHVFDWPNSPNRFSIELQALDGWVETFICCLSQRVNDAEHIYSLIRLQSIRWVNVWLWSVKQSCGSFLLFCFFALYLTSLFFAYVWNGE